MDNADTEDVTLDLETEPEPEPAKAETDPAAEAFARLRGEMALMRRAVQQLAAERADIVIPDYQPTLNEMDKRLSAVSDCLEDIAEHPAMQVTPEDFGRQIKTAAEAARRGDQERIVDATNELRRAAQTMQTVTANAREKTEQRRSLFHAAGGGVLAGIVLWSFLPGAIARAAPESWQWPERMARHVLGERTVVDAGIRMVRMANPQAWEAIAFAAKLSDTNAEAIERCKAKASKAKQPVDCVLRIAS